MPLSPMDTTCQHLGTCGGCSGPLPYPEELLRKEARVHSLVAPYHVDEWRPMIPSPDPWHYRNKMEYAFGAVDSGLTLGLRQAGRFDRVVDVETCFLMSEESLEVLKRTRTWARERGLSGYNRRLHTGDLRYLVLREGKHTAERMAVLIARTLPDGLDALRARWETLVTTAYLGITECKGDVARADDMKLLWGPGTIDENLGTLRYRISPYSFFQTNTRGTERLYGLLREWASALRTGGALLDLYCGSGGITLAVADLFDRAIGIDTNRDAIEDAKENAGRNGIRNAEFVCEDVLEFLKKLPASKVSVQLAGVVVDPPRAGLHPKALRALLDMNPVHLVYVSCNPESLARDLQTLVPFYKIRSAQPVDLFPHTPHVETVAILEHR